MTGPGNDVTLAFRMLLGQPGFTSIAMLTLAVRIGNTSAIFSVVNGVVLRPLPFAGSERLIVLSAAGVYVCPCTGATRQPVDLIAAHR